MSEGRLAEATALLVTIRTRLISSHPESASDIDAFISRASVPAATPAPEPSAEQVECPACKHWFNVTPTDATRETILQHQDDSIAALERAETAEAKLATVRRVVDFLRDVTAAARRNREPKTGMQVPYLGEFCSATPSVIRDLERFVRSFDAALLRPGGGTGEKTYRATCRVCAAPLNRDNGASIEPSDCPACGAGGGK